MNFKNHYKTKPKARQNFLPFIVVHFVKLEKLHLI